MRVFRQKISRSRASQKFFIKKVFSKGNKVLNFSNRKKVPRSRASRLVFLKEGIGNRVSL